MAALTSAILGAGLAGYQIYEGAQQKKQAQAALDNYQRQELKNPYENIQISTIGSDLIRQESGRTTANLVDASRNAGIRGIMGNLPRIQAYNNLQNQEAQKYLDDQNIKRQYAIAGDETNLRQIREQRDFANISALGSQFNAGNIQMWDGIKGVGGALMYGADAYGRYMKKPTGETPPLTLQGSNSPASLNAPTNQIIYPEDPFGREPFNAPYRANTLYQSNERISKNG